MGLKSEFSAEVAGTEREKTQEADQKSVLDMIDEMEQGGISSKELIEIKQRFSEEKQEIQGEATKKLKLALIRTILEKYDIHKGKFEKQFGAVSGIDYDSDYKITDDAVFDHYDVETLRKMNITREELVEALNNGEAILKAEQAEKAAAEKAAAEKAAAEKAAAEKAAAEKAAEKAAAEKAAAEKAAAEKAAAEKAAKKGTIEAARDYYKMKGIDSRMMKIYQTDLAKLGYDVPVEGIFESQTFEGIKKFQKDQGLHIDGIIGEDTGKVLADSMFERQKTENERIEKIRKAQNGEASGDTQTKESQAENNDMSEFMEGFKEGLAGGMDIKKILEILDEIFGRPDFNSFESETGEKVGIEYDSKTNTIHIDTPFFDGLSDYPLDITGAQITSQEDAEKYVKGVLENIKKEYDKKALEAKLENKWEVAVIRKVEVVGQEMEVSLVRNAPTDIEKGGVYVKLNTTWNDKVGDDEVTEKIGEYGDKIEASRLEEAIQNISKKYEEYYNARNTTQVNLATEKSPEWTNPDKVEKTEAAPVEKEKDKKTDQETEKKSLWDRMTSIFSSEKKGNKTLEIIESVDNGSWSSRTLKTVEIDGEQRAIDLQKDGEDLIVTVDTDFGDSVYDHQTRVVLKKSGEEYTQTEIDTAINQAIDNYKTAKAEVAELEVKKPKAEPMINPDVPTK